MTTRPSLRITIVAIGLFLAACGKDSTTFVAGQAVEKRETTPPAAAGGNENAVANGGEENAAPGDEGARPATTVASGPGTGTGLGQGQGGEGDDPGLVTGNGIERRATFASTQTKANTLSFDPELGIHSTEVKMLNKYGDETATLPAQVSRTLYNKTYTQGTPGVPYTEQFNQTNLGLLDIQIVVDNSGSMDKEHANLATRLGPLLQSVQNANWQINITTTDADGSDPCSSGLLRKGEANLDTRFAAIINGVGTNGNGNEMGILRAVQGLSCSAAAWVRPSSSVAVLIVADEDNCSNNGGDCSAPYNHENYLLDHLRTAMGRTLGTDARVYGIIWRPGTVCDTGYNQGYQYSRAVTATSGTAGSICDASYTTTLNQISADMATILKAEYTLKAAPDGGVATVLVNGVRKTTGWSITGTTLKFTEVPPVGAVIDVSYVAGAVEIVNKFELPAEPAPETLKVTINDAAVPSADYTVDLTEPGKVWLRFGTRPADLAKIVAEFRENAPLKSTWTVPGDVIASTLKVKVNGVDTTAFSLAGTNLTFSSPPPDGASIGIAYSRLVGPILSYPVTFAGTPRAIQVTDKVSGAAVAHVFSGTTLTIAADDHVANRTLLITYKNELSGKMTLTLDGQPVAATVKVSATGDACAAPGAVTLTGNKLYLACDFASPEPVTVTYSYKTVPATAYSLDGIFNPDSGTWTVVVNDTPTTAYTRSGATITLGTTPPVDSTVTLIFAGVR